MQAGEAGRRAKQLCGRCVARDKLGTGPPTRAPGGFVCACQRVFPSYTLLLQHERKTCSSEEVRVQVRLLALGTDGQDVFVVVPKNVLLPALQEQVAP